MRRKTFEFLLLFFEAEYRQTFNYKENKQNVYDEKTRSLFAILFILATNVFAQSSTEQTKIRTMLQSIKYKATAADSESGPAESKALRYFSVGYNKLVTAVGGKAVDLMPNLARTRRQSSRDFTACEVHALLSKRACAGCPEHY